MTVERNTPTGTNGAVAGKGSSEELVRKHLAASQRVIERVSQSNEQARAFLIRAGIVDKSGEGLAPPYR